MRIERPGRATRPGGASPPRTDTQIPRRKQPAAAKVDTGHQVGKFDEQLWATWVSVINEELLNRPGTVVAPSRLAHGRLDVRGGEQ